MTSTLIDEFLPVYNSSMHHRIEIDAPIGQAEGEPRQRRQHRRQRVGIGEAVERSDPCADAGGDHRRRRPEPDQHRPGRSSSQDDRTEPAVDLDELDQRGIGLTILNLGIDTKTPAGRLIFTIVGAVAAMERELLVERTQSGLAAARARGRVGGRRRSFRDTSTP